MEQVAVIVLQYGKTELTQTCLACLRSQQGVNLTIWLVDGGTPSLDQKMFSAATALADHAQILSENLGFAGGNNVVLKDLPKRFEYVFILNNDTELPDTCLAELVACAERHPKAAQIAPLVLYPDGSVQGAGGEIREDLYEPRMRGNREALSASYSHEEQVTFASGCSVLVRTAAIQDVGLIPEEYFMYSEDVHWSLAFHEAGWEIWYTPKTRVTHFESAGSGMYSPFKGYYLTRSHVLLAARWLEPKRYGLFLRRMAAKLLRQSVKYVAHPAYVIAMWRGFTAGLHDRTKRAL